MRYQTGSLMKLKRFFKAIKIKVLDYIPRYSLREGSGNFLKGSICVYLFKSHRTNNIYLVY